MNIIEVQNNVFRVKDIKTFRKFSLNVAPKKYKLDIAFYDGTSDSYTFTNANEINRTYDELKNLMLQEE